MSLKAEGDLTAAVVAAMMSTQSGAFGPVLRGLVAAVRSLRLSPERTEAARHVSNIIEDAAIAAERYKL